MHYILYNPLSSNGSGKKHVARIEELLKSENEEYEVIDLVDEMKGEFVIIVEGNNEVVDYSSMSIIEHVKVYVDDGMSEKDAIKLVSKERNVAKSIVYKEYHLGK